MSLFTFCETAESEKPLRVREPAVAGRFYPENPEALKSMIAACLKEKPPVNLSPRMLISPHAGYVFSGPIAGKGFALLDKSISTVILIGPSHHARFQGISIPSVDAYRTPLGTVLLHDDIVTKLRSSPLVTTVEQAHMQEHCLEVQIPFLYYRIPSIRIVPCILGVCNPEEVADLLLPFINESVLVIASSDLSHFHTYDKAKQIDSVSIKTIMSGNTSGPIDGCGKVPIRVVMHLAEKLSLEPHLLGAGNSFETAPEYGSRNRVVGYVSIAYTKKSTANKNADRDEENSIPTFEPSPDSEHAFLLSLARTSLEAAVHGKPPPNPETVPENLTRQSGCFVTLTTPRGLRGCIGNIEPVKPLYQGIIDNARSAALHDPRFPAVTPKELDDIVVEVSILTPPEPVSFSSPDELLSLLRPGKDGIILQKGIHQATFLPQVWDQLSDKIQFLEHLSLKARLPRDGWKTAEVKRYRAIHFQEK